MPRSTDLLDPATDELVAGRRPVEEAFVARREARRLLVVPQRRQALEKLVLHATSLRIPIVEVEGGTLTALSGFDGHQGVALVVAPRRYAEVDDILARAIERGEAPFVLVLDSLEDPQNVGTLLRSAEAAATHGVVFPTRHQAPMSPSAIKASAGAVEHLLLAPVDDLPGALADLHVRGLRIVGADADAALTVREADLRGPLALVVGSEGQGLGPAVRRRCDLLVRIPMRGAVGSLNASVAGSILLYEATTQRVGSTQPRPVDARPAAEPASEIAPVDEPVIDPEPIDGTTQPAERPEEPPAGGSAKPTRHSAGRAGSKKATGHTGPTIEAAPATDGAVEHRTTGKAGARRAATNGMKAKTRAASKPVDAKGVPAKNAPGKATSPKAVKTKTPSAAKPGSAKAAAPKAGKKKAPPAAKPPRARPAAARTPVPKAPASGGKGSASGGKGSKSGSGPKKTSARGDDPDALLPGGPPSEV